MNNHSPFLINLAIDISPLSNPSVGIGRSVAGLMSELPAIASSAGVNLRPYFRKALGRLSDYGLAEAQLSRLRVPMAAEKWVRKFGLVELLTGSNLFHATDFYLPLKKATPAISTVHDVIYANQSEGTGGQGRIKQAMRDFVPQCVRVISCSEYSAREFCKLYGYPMERVQVIGWGGDEKYKPSFSQIIDEFSPPYFFRFPVTPTAKTRRGSFRHSFAMRNPVGLTT